MNNRKLAKMYNTVFKTGASNFFTFETKKESKAILEMIPSWSGTNVLEIGCGEGYLSEMIARNGAQSVTAVDYSAEAITIASSRISLPNISFLCADFHKLARHHYDIIVLQGVTEHLDKPFEDLDHLITTHLSPDGALISSSPSFLNPRGYVWMALKLLLDVPMSLTDLHFLSPFDFEDFCKTHKYSLTYKSIDQDWGAGDRTIVDFRKRLPNALRDAGLRNDRVTMFLSWFERALAYHQSHDASGATVIYKIMRTKV